MTDRKLSNAAEAFLNIQKHKFFINNKWRASSSEKYMPVVNPAKSNVIGEIGLGDAAEVDMAVKSARKALESKEWSTMSPADRELLILKLADTIEDHIIPLAEILTLENGKLFAHAKSEIKGAIRTFRYYAGWATKIEGQTLDLSLKQKPGFKNFGFTKKEPIGVVAAIVPWNFPISIASWKLAPLLAAGCTCVLKPSEESPLSTLYLAQLFEVAGFPEGVLNVITGDAVTGAALTNHAGLDKITFTGSTQVGRIIGKTAMQNLIPISLELGGKSPAIVFNDADLKSAAKGVALGIFRNGGQVCVAGSRVYIQKEVFDEVVEKIVSEGKNLKISHGFDEDSDLGPLVSEGHLNNVLKHVEKGVNEGAELICGGKKLDREGSYLEPTVFTTKNNKMDLVQEEIFGPVLIAVPFNDESDALRMANDSKYGLSSTVWTKDISKAMRCVDMLNAGWVFVNSPARSDSNLPLGGNKNSGIGRELGKEGLYTYLKTKSVNIVY